MMTPASLAALEAEAIGQLDRAESLRDRGSSDAVEVMRLALDAAIAVRQLVEAARRAAGDPAAPVRGIADRSWDGSATPETVLAARIRKIIGAGQ
jgi:hypothetical protein